MRRATSALLLGLLVWPATAHAQAEAELVYQRRLESLQGELEAATRSLGPAHRDVARLHHRIGVFWESRRQYALAEQSYAASARVHPRLFGVLTREALGRVALLSGELDRAEQHLEWVLAERRRLGPARPNLARSIAASAGVKAARGSHEAAAALYQEAIAMYEATIGGERHEVNTLRVELGQVWLRAGQPERARPLLDTAIRGARAALTERENRHGLEHPELLGALEELSALLELAGRGEEGEKSRRQALGIVRRLEPRNRMRAALAEARLGLNLLGQKRREEAEGCFRRAEEEHAGAGAPRDPGLVPMYLGFAGLLREGGREEEAALREARAMEIRVGNVEVER